MMDTLFQADYYGFPIHFDTFINDQRKLYLTRYTDHVENPFQSWIIHSTRNKQNLHIRKIGLNTDFYFQIFDPFFALGYYQQTNMRYNIKNGLVITLNHGIELDQPSVLLLPTGDFSLKQAFQDRDGETLYPLLKKLIKKHKTILQAFTQNHLSIGNFNLVESPFFKIFQEVKEPLKTKKPMRMEIEL